MELILFLLKVGWVRPKRGCLLMLSYYTTPRWYEFGEQRWNDIDRGKSKNRRKTCTSTTLSTTNPTWIDPGTNPGLRGERPATTDMSNGTAQGGRVSFRSIDVRKKKFRNTVPAFILLRKNFRNGVPPQKPWLNPMVLVLPEKLIITQQVKFTSACNWTLSWARWIQSTPLHGGMIYWQGKTEELGKNLSQCHFVHNKSRMDWPGREPGPPRWEAGD
jgi:hypothetical protein